MSQGVQLSRMCWNRRDPSSPAGYGHPGLLLLALSFPLTKGADLLGCCWSGKKSASTFLVQGGGCLKPPSKRARCCFSLNLVFGVTHHFLQEMGKLEKLLNSRSTLSKAALGSGGGIFFYCLSAILTLCTKISIVRTICGLNIEFQDIG